MKEVAGKEVFWEIIDKRVFLEKEWFDGVELDPLKVNQSKDGGILIEVFKKWENVLVGEDIMQVNFKEAPPGTVMNEFHIHQRQTDYWFVVKGRLRVGLFDFRDRWPTFRQNMIVLLGDWDKKCPPFILKIPCGVGHAFKVEGDNNLIMIYGTSRVYNPEDEGRIPFNDKKKLFGRKFSWQKIKIK